MEHDKQLTSENQHTAPSPEQETTLIVPSSLPSATQDETELEERHGGQYHLRHQLSGCAQTLHTVDFQQDFFLPEPESEHILFVPALRDDQQSMLSPAFSAGTDPLAGLQSQHFSTTMDPAIEPASLPPAVHESTHSPAASFALPHAVNHAFSSAAATSISANVLPEQVMNIDSNVESSPATETYRTDVNEMALGDWLLSTGLNAEQKLENGRLHFLGDELQANQILLQQRFVLSESTHFQFEMAINVSEGSELPQFTMLINDVSVPMETCQVGDAVVLRSEFMMTANEPVNLAIFPVHSLPSGASLWIDNLRLQPSQPDSSRSELMVDAPHDNAHSEISLIVQEKHPGLAQILVSDTPDIFPPIHPEVHDASSTVTLDSMIGESHLAQWNTVSTGEHPLSGIQLETPSFLTTDLPHENVFDT